MNAKIFEIREKNSERIKRCNAPKKEKEKKIHRHSEAKHKQTRPKTGEWGWGERRDTFLGKSRGSGELSVRRLLAGTYGARGPGTRTGPRRDPVPITACRQAAIIEPHRRPRTHHRTPKVIKQNEQEQHSCRKQNGARRCDIKARGRAERRFDGATWQRSGVAVV